MSRLPVSAGSEDTPAIFRRNRSVIVFGDVADLSAGNAVRLSSKHPVGIAF
jgi:hypothetical protein